MTNKNFSVIKRLREHCLVLFMVLLPGFLLSACQSAQVSQGVTLEQSLPVTLRDMDNEYAAAKRANLSFYSPRFFKNAEKSYQTISALRGKPRQIENLENHLAIFKHNLDRAYDTKALVQKRIGKLLVRYLRLESKPSYEKYPQQFEEVEKLMSKCLKLLELRQIDSLSWDKLQADKFDTLRNQFSDSLDKLEKLR